MQQLELGNSDLGETNLVVKRMKRATTQGVNNLRTSGVDFSMDFRAKPLNTKNREKSNIENATSISCGIRFR